MNLFGRLVVAAAISATVAGYAHSQALPSVGQIFIHGVRGESFLPLRTGEKAKFEIEVSYNASTASAQIFIVVLGNESGRQRPFATANSSAPKGSGTRIFNIELEVPDAQAIRVIAFLWDARSGYRPASDVRTLNVPPTLKLAGSNLTIQSGRECAADFER